MEVARKDFGVTPRKFQVDTATAIVEGKHVILRKGTGEGKTMAFILSYMSWKRVKKGNKSRKPVLMIITPLKSIMQDQHKSFKMKYKGESEVTSGILGTLDQDNRNMDAFMAGNLEVVWLAPEYLFGTLLPKTLTSTLSRLKTQNTLMIVIDEAHTVIDCMSYRSDYQRIWEVCNHFPKAITLWTSATLPKSTVNRIETSISQLSKEANPGIEKLLHNIDMSHVYQAVILKKEPFLGYLTFLRVELK